MLAVMHCSIFSLVYFDSRLVLCACSPLFRDMLTRQPPRPRRPDLQPVVFLKDVSPVHFERLLQFMYCGKVQVPNNELEDLLATATSLSVHGLAQPQAAPTAHPTVTLPHPTVTLPHLPEPPLTPKPAAPPKKRRISRDCIQNKSEFLNNHYVSKKSPLSTLDSNQILKSTIHSSSTSPPRSVLHVQTRGKLH